MAKIGIYTYFPAYIGGGERYIMTLASSLQDEHEVCFLCANIIGYQGLAERLNIDVSKVKFIEFNGVINLKKYLLNVWLKKYNPEYELFIVLSNTIIPPIIGIGKKNILQIQFPYPYPKKDLFNLKKFVQRLIIKKSYDLVMVYSEFVRNYVDTKSRHTYSIEVIYPPVETQELKYIPYHKKKNQIISVGRFIGTKDSKCQLEMVQFFKKMYNLNPNLDIKYICIGGERPEGIHQKYLNRVKEEAKNYPIDIITNASIGELIELYSESKFFWHGKGYLAGRNNPEYTEHFGISTVEAMASGCIPLAYKAGGQLEIINDGSNGYLWTSGDELIQKTVNLMKNPENAFLLSENAYIKSKIFSNERFKQEVKKVISDIVEL